MMLKLKNLRAHSIVGVYEEEKKAPRPLVISLVVEYDHTKAIESDNIEHALDYALIENAVVAALATREFNLIETVAEFICQLLFADERVSEVTVEVEKPGVMRFAESISVIHTMIRE